MCCPLALSYERCKRNAELIDFFDMFSCSNKHMLCWFVAGWNHNFFIKTLYLETFQASGNKIDLGKALFPLITQTKMLLSLVVKLGSAIAYNYILPLPVFWEQFLLCPVFQENPSCINLSRCLTKFLGHSTW